MSNNNRNSNSQNITFFLDEPDEITNELDTYFDINNVLQEIESNENISTQARTSR